MAGGYVSIFGSGGSSSAKAAGMPTQKDSSGKQGYKSIFGGPTIQQATDDEIRQRNEQQAKDAAAKAQADAKQAQQDAQNRANNSILGKVKSAAKSTVTDIVHTGEKVVNTGAALDAGVIGAGIATGLKATGHNGAAAQTVAKTNKTVDTLLDHGAGNQGSYISSKQAAMTDMPKPKSNSILDRTKAAGKSTVNDFVKPVAKASAEIAPYVIPAGKAVEGGSLIARVATKVSPELETAVRSEKLLPSAARAFTGNAAVGAGTDATNQLLDTGHVNLKQTGIAALEAGAIGTVMHGVTHAGTSLFAKVRQNNVPEHIATIPTGDGGTPGEPALPQPGEVIQPQPQTARAEMLQDTPAIVPSEPSVPLAHNGPIRAQPTLPFDGPVEGQLPASPEAAPAPRDIPVQTPEAPVKAAPVEQATPKPEAIESPKEAAPKPTPKAEPAKVTKQNDHIDEVHNEKVKASGVKAGPDEVVQQHYDNGEQFRTKKIDDYIEEYRKSHAYPTERGFDYALSTDGLSNADRARLMDRYRELHGHEADPMEEVHKQEEAKRVADQKAKEDKQKSTSVTSKVKKAEPKPEPIDGFHTSDQMRQEHAKMLRDYDQQAKGGNKYHLHENGAPDVGEKSPFYKQFRKENGKAPTKADYDAEAHMQLMKGNDKETYTKLLEREGKISPAPKEDSPAPKPEPKPEPTPVKAPTPPVEKPAGEGSDKGISRTAASVQQKALEKGLEKDYGQLAEYDKTTIKKQAEQATELLNGPRDDIEAILAGEKQLPQGLKAATFIKAIEEHPEYGHDPDMLRDLGRSDIHKQISTAAQELRLSRERNPNSSVEAIRQIGEIRKAAFKEKYGKTAEKAQSEEVKAIRETQPKLDLSDWDHFIDSIKC